MAQDDGGRDTLFMFLNDVKLDLGVFDKPGQTKDRKVLNGISFRRESLSAPTNMGFNQEFLDQSHKVVVDIPQHIFQRGSLLVKFEADVSRSELVQSAGIDNFRLTGHSKQCRVSWTGEELPASSMAAAKKRGKHKRDMHDHGNTKKNSGNNGKSMAKTKNDTDDEEEEPEGDAELKKKAAVQKKNKNKKRLLGDVEECREAYAFHSGRLSVPFSDMGFKDRFGWSSGPISDSNFAYSFDLYAEADEDDLETSVTSEGRLVGCVSVDYNGVEVVVTIDTSAPFYLEGTHHAYVGIRSRLPKIDGKSSTDLKDFPIIHESNLQAISNDDVSNTSSDVSVDHESAKKTSFTFVVSDFKSQPINVIAQTIVCGDFAATPDQDSGTSANRGFRGAGVTDENNAEEKQPEGDQVAATSTWGSLKNHFGLS